MSPRRPHARRPLAALVCLAASGCGVAAAQDADGQNRARIAAMTAEQRRALQLKDEEFRALPAAERARLEELHAALRADDVAGGTLGDTMRRYLDLLGRLDDEQRARLRDATDPAARVGELRRIAAEGADAGRLDDDPLRGRWSARLRVLTDAAFEQITRDSYFPRDVRERAAASDPPEAHLMILNEATNDGEVTDADRWLKDTTLERIAAELESLAPDRPGPVDDGRLRRLRGFTVSALAAQLRREWTDRAWDAMRPELHNFFLSLPSGERSDLLADDDERRRTAILVRYLSDESRRTAAGDVGARAGQALRLAFRLDPPRGFGRGFRDGRRGPDGRGPEGPGGREPGDRGRGGPAPRDGDRPPRGDRPDGPPPGGRDGEPPPPGDAGPPF